MQLHPFQQTTAIGSIDPNAAKLFTSSSQAHKEQLRPSSVGDRSCCNHNGHQQTHRIDQDVTFPTGHFLARVVATYAWMGCHLDTLTVQRSSRWVFMSARLTADLCSKLVMKLLPGSIAAKAAKVGITALPCWILFGQHSPLTPCDGHIQDRVDHRSHTQRSGAASRFCYWYQLFDTIPLGLSQIGWIDLSGCFHLSSLSHLTDCLPTF
jgi:hypothetical protein